MFAENLNLFFEDKGFGTEAKITLAGEAVRKVQVIFDNTVQAIELEDSTVAAHVPMFQCKTADLAGVRTRKDTASINGKTYVIERKEDDGTGVSTVYLRT